MWTFADLRFDPVRRILFAHGEAVHLPPREADLLRVLLEAQGEVVSKEALLNRIWNDCAVEEGNLAQQVSLLRRALSAAGEGVSYIETVPKIGYRFAVAAGQSAEERAVSETRRLTILLTAFAALLLGWISYHAGALHQHCVPIRTPMVAVQPVENDAGDGALDWLSVEINGVIDEALRHAGIRIVGAPKPGTL